MYDQPAPSEVIDMLNESKLLHAKHVAGKTKLPLKQESPLWNIAFGRPWNHDSRLEKVRNTPMMRPGQYSPELEEILGKE
jgi:hypothetical protein